MRMGLRCLESIPVPASMSSWPGGWGNQVETPTENSPSLAVQTGNAQLRDGEIS